eukprot:4340845-Prymnesium_polylepis.1
MQRRGRSRPERDTRIRATTHPRDAAPAATPAHSVPKRQGGCVRGCAPRATTRPKCSGTEPSRRGWGALGLGSHIEPLCRRASHWPLSGVADSPSYMGRRLLAAARTGSTRGWPRVERLIWHAPP